MATAHSSWLTKVGLGMAVVCAFYSLSAVLSGVQIYFVQQVSGSLFGAELPNFRAVIWASTAVLVLKSALNLISVSALVRLLEPGSIWLALGTLLFGYPISGILMSLCNSMLLGTDFQFRHPEDFVSAIDVIIGVWIAGYLLLSRRVELTYGTGSRRWILNKVTTTWRLLRGRDLYGD